MQKNVATFDEYIKRLTENRLNWWIVLRLLYGSLKVNCTAREYQVFVSSKSWVDMAASLLLLGLVFLWGLIIWQQP